MNETNRAYLAFVWWLIKVTTFVASVAINVFFFVLLLGS